MSARTGAHLVPASAWLFDLFFWDSVSRFSETSVQCIRSLVEKAEDLKITLILGDIPPLIGRFQISLGPVNGALHRCCAHSPFCHLLPLDALYHDVLRKGYLEYKSLRYSIPELIPDGLHVNPIAADFLADEIAKLL